MPMKNEQTMKKTLKEGGNALILTLCAVGLAYGAVKNALGAAEVYHKEMDSAIEKSVRVGMLVFSALFLAAMSGSLVDIGVDIRRQKQVALSKEKMR